MFTLRIWVFKSGVLKNVFILSKHGTKANIRSTKMANNRHGRRLHEAEIGSRLTNGSCAMFLNSNNVVLNTMPDVIVDVGLPTVDV
jgi:hypothetical protein